MGHSVTCHCHCPPLSSSASPPCRASAAAAVPILIPHVNAEHLSIVRHQQAVKGYDKGGFIVTNANCSSTGLVVALKVAAAPPHLSAAV